MHRLTKVAASLLCTALLAGCGGGSVALMPQGPSSSRTLAAPLGPTSIVPASGVTYAMCAPSTSARRASCLGQIRMTSTTTSAFPDSVDGLTPSDLASIYGYTTPASQATTTAVIGIVVAYDNANVESDLATYRTKFGLPACTTANGCFTKLGASATTAADVATRTPQSVSAHPESTVTGWAAEADADVEAASAVCANCKIVLSEAVTDNLSDLASAVAVAVSKGATIVNASFGAPEASTQTSMESSFEPSGVRVVAAAGDGGPAALFPASATNVIAVAGTTINVSGTTVSESLWSSSGGGCSAVFAKASFQPAWCGKRSIADVAAVGDPNTGLAFYDSALSGWGIVGGTSISAPIIAGMYALSSDISAGNGARAMYTNASHFVQTTTTGNLDGLGTPSGLKAF